MENSDRVGFNRREIEVWRLANEEIERECWPLDHAILGAVYAGAAPSLLDLSALVAAAVEHRLWLVHVRGDGKRMFVVVDLAGAGSSTLWAKIQQQHLSY